MTETTYCYIHPTREASLRCKSCDRYICSSCAKRSPTGYICGECVRQREKVFETALWYDFLVVFVASSFLSAIAAGLTVVITFFVWGIFIIGLAPLAGSGIATATRLLIKNRRSRALSFTLAAGMILGALPVMFLSGLPGLLIMFTGGADFMSLFYSFGPIFWQIVYLVLATPLAYSQFSGIVFRR